MCCWNWVSQIIWEGGGVISIWNKTQISQILGLFLHLSPLYLPQLVTELWRAHIVKLLCDIFIMSSSLEKEIHDLMAAMTPVVPQEKKYF